MVDRAAQPTEIEQAQADDAVLDKVRAQLSGPRTMKDPGSPEWCWQTIGHLQLMWEFFESAGGTYLSVLEEAEAYKVWEVVPEGNPFGTRENMVAVLNIGDEQAARERLRREALQAAALRAGPGRPTNGDNGAARHHLPKGSNQTAYLMARIARDRPDVLERAQQGEFKSATDAARAAGIVFKRTRTMSLSDDVERVAGKLGSHYTLEQIAALTRRLLQMRREGRRNAD